MTSKELNEILNKTRRTPNISLTPEQVEEIIKDLEALEIIKSVIFLTNNSYYIQTKKRLNEEDYKLIKECLNNVK